MIKLCAVCRKEFITYPSKLLLGRGKYCSKACCLSVTNDILEESGVGTRFSKGQESWNKIGFSYTTGRKGGKTYRLVYLPDHPNADKKGNVREHRLVMEKFLNRFLSRDEVVHHKDGNPLNNDINNLIVLTAKEHKILHLKDTIHKRWVTSPRVSHNKANY